MAEDIVTRLLDVVCWCNEFDGVCDACQAADEINRLRRFKAEAMAVLDRWQAVADLVPTERRSLGEHWADIVAAEIERLRNENQMLNEALANKGTKQVAKIVSTTSSCDEWMLPIFAKHNRHLCDGCGREKFHHSYEWVPAVTPLGGSYKPWSLEQIDKWREDDLISKERYHFLISVTEDFDKPKAVRYE